MMRRLAAAFAVVGLLVLVTGCQYIDPGYKLYGRWQMDKEATVAANTKDAPLKAAALRTALDLWGKKVEMQFNRDGTAVFTGGFLQHTGSQTGAWDAESLDGDTLTIKYRNDIVNEIKQVKLTFRDADTFEYNPEIGSVNTVVFKRAKEGG